MIKNKFIYLFIFAAALAQGVMWINVFSLIQDGLWTYVGGVPAGLAIVGLVVFSANSLPRVQSKRARQGGWILLVLVMVVEPVVLGVVNWWSMPTDFRVSPVSYVVAGGISLVISLVLVMTALIDRSLIAAEKPTQPTTKPKKASYKPAQPVFICPVAGCTAKPFGSQSALNAHQRKHKQGKP